MKAKRQPPKAAGRGRGAAALRDDDRRRTDGRSPARRPVDSPPRDKRPGPAREQRALRHGPASAPATTPIPRKTQPKNTRQAKARAKARKAKAPKIVRVPLRERMRIRIARLAEIDLNPRTLLAKVPFVVLVIAALGLGLGVTLWLSTYAAERSYQLGHARRTNEALLQQKESLERQVLQAQAAPALAEAARNLGMIPSRDTAHLVQDPTGNWIVVGSPKPAQGVSPPPLNVKLSDDPLPADNAGSPAQVAERPVRIGGPIPAAPVPAPVPEVALPQNHAPTGPATAPLGAPPTGPAPGPAVAAPGLVIVPVPAQVPAPAAAPVPVPVHAAPPAPAAAPLPAPADAAPPAPAPVPGAPA